MKAACLPAPSRGSVLGHVRDHGEVLVDGVEQGPQAGEVVDEGLAPPGRGSGGVGGDDPGRAADLGLEDPREVDLTVKACPQQPVTMTLAEVVAPKFGSR